jgi:hypothetical protein
MQQLQLRLTCIALDPEDARFIHNAHVIHNADDGRDTALAGMQHRTCSVYSCWCQQTYTSTEGIAAVSQQQHPYQASNGHHGCPQTRIISAASSTRAPHAASAQ